jgi:hypothetical protein
MAVLLLAAGLLLRGSASNPGSSRGGSDGERGGCNGLSLHPGVSIGNGHFRSQPNSTVAACCEFCSRAGLRCVTFVFSRRGGGSTCYLMDNTRPGVYQGPDVTTGCYGWPCREQVPPPPPPPPPPGWKMCRNSATGQRGSSSSSSSSSSCHNVLMLAVDDLRPVGKVFGQPEALVPTLDKLASESVVFTNAWVQVRALPFPPQRCFGR